MIKITVAIATLTLLLLVPTWGQPKPRKMQRKIQPKQSSNFSWGESNSTTQSQNSQRKQPRNMAKNQDIEVENDETHRTKQNRKAFRPNPSGDGTTQHFKTTQKSNPAGNQQNLLPYMEQTNRIKGCKRGRKN